MPRPTYERGTNRRDERRIAEELRMAWGGEFRPMPPFHRADYGWYRNGTLSAYVEIKRRQFDLRYAEFDPFLSKHKFDALVEMAREKDVDAFFVIGGSRTIASCDLLDVMYDVRANSGRTRATRDEYDIEDMVMLPRWKWEEVCEWEPHGVLTK